MVSNKNILIMAAMLLSGSVAWGQSADSTFIDEPVPPVEIVKADTIIYQEPSLITTKIRALARTYGDSIALRQPDMPHIIEAREAIGRLRSDIHHEVILYDISEQNITRFKTNDYETIFGN